MKILKWIAVLPASILAMLLSTLLLKYILPILWSSESINTDALYYQSIIAMTNVMAFIYAGVFIAPTHRNIVLKILCILAFVFQSYQIYIFYDIIIVALKYITWSEFYKNIGLIMIVRLVVSLGTCVFGYYYVKKELEELE